MNLIIHDLSQQNFTELYPSPPPETTIIWGDDSIHHCIGCFSCWIKTPGVCVLKDHYNNMGKLLFQSSQLVIISQCTYGSYSPFVRNVLDRSLPYLLPYFVTINHETHHKNRYPNSLNVSVHFYGNDITDKEKETARKLVSANGVNFYFSNSNVHFHNDYQSIKGELFL